MSKDFYRVEFGTKAATRTAPRHSAGPNLKASPVAVPIDTPEAPSSLAPPASSDSVLVPLDQWNRLLGQLGNIHEAGQQLAEARERMGRAETENVFLKERIRDLRTQLEPNQSQPDELPAVPVDPPPSQATDVGSPSGRTLKVEFKIPAWLTRRRHRA